jgi:Glycosyl hydrolases family 43
MTVQSPSPSTPRRSCRPRHGGLGFFVRVGHAIVSTLASMFALVTLTAAVAAVGLAAAPAPTAGAANSWAPVTAGDFPDPSVFFDPVSNAYYAFATQSTGPGQINIQVSTSSDGVHWSVVTGYDALPQLPPWAAKGNTWAPSVAYDSPTHQYVMYFAATDAGQGVQCLGVATSATPLGPYEDPYTDPNQPPIQCDVGLGGDIDPNIFTDPKTGTSYLLWKNDGNRFGEPTQIWSALLGSDLLPPNGSLQNPVVLFGGPDQAWQGNVVEGPDMYYAPPRSGQGSGTYYLFYAGGAVDSNTYAIGWATCTGPTGGCTDGTTNNPLLTTAPGMSGPGGPDVYSRGGQSSGQSVMAFAAWQGNTIGYGACGFRPMYLADLAFGQDGTPSLAPDNPGAAPAASPSCPQPPTPPPGYWQVASDGGVFTFGAAGFYGSTGSMRLNKPVVGMAPTPDHKGYWLVASDGGVFAFGDAGFYGSTGSMVLNKPIIGMIPTLDGRGYWLFASDGGVFAFGDAPFYGSAGGAPPAYPVTAVASAFLAGGYWLVDSNGEVFTYGDARYFGAPPFAPGGFRITGMTATHNSNGYWLASANGNVAVFGNAAPYGSMYGTNLNSPIVGMASTYDGGGYWLQGGDGGIFTFGDAPYLGSMGGQHLNAPMVGIAAM